jgi:GNAT superfamily N-acetyltransferase
MSAVEYKISTSLNPADVARVFDSSGITRPTADLNRILRMFSPPSLIISAWHQGNLIGVSRSLTDYSYCCYLSDLAVVKEFQGKGIGRELVNRTRVAIGDEVSLILVSAPGAMSYYPLIGFERSENAFIIKRRR